MGTSTTGSELHSDKLAKLQARKKELETLLAAKNEDLYKLCVQEVNLTGVMPPEAPVEASPSPVEVRREGTEGRRTRPVQRQSVEKGKEAPSTSRKQISHRLSTPSISGLSIKSNPVRRADHASASCSTLSHDVRDTFSLHSSQTYPTLQLGHEREPAPAPAQGSYSRHHTLTTERVNKLHYLGNQPDTQSFSRETHFSSSHPDITTHYSHNLLTTQPQGAGNNVPLLYQYASQLKARSPHLSSVQQRPRRTTLQRTQTYHLTAHSDHPPPHPPQLPSPLSPMSPLAPLSPLSTMSMNTGSNPSIYSSQSAEAQDREKIKEKEWYESSLDSPTSSSGMNLSKESIHYHSPKKVVQRSPSVAQPPLPSPPPAPQSPQLPPPPPIVPLESPKNCTVVESGKWFPYREVSKPFEMSDFYKYSTKYRQNTTQRSGLSPSHYPPPQEEVRTYNSPEQWHQAHPL